jgi:DNA-binding GntR family transcriptional regulator
LKGDGMAKNSTASLRRLEKKIDALVETMAARFCVDQITCASLHQIAQHLARIQRQINCGNAEEDSAPESKGEGKPN